MPRKETIYRKIIKNIKWSMKTLSIIYRYRLQMTLTSVDMLYLYML